MVYIGCIQPPYYPGWYTRLPTILGGLPAFHPIVWFTRLSPNSVVYPPMTHQCWLPAHDPSMLATRLWAQDGVQWTQDGVQWAPGCQECGGLCAEVRFNRGFYGVCTSGYPIFPIILPGTLRTLRRTGITILTLLGDLCAKRPPTQVNLSS